MKRPSSLELMRLHVQAGYVHDGGGRVVRVNEPHGKQAPRFWLGRTNEGVLWRFGNGLPVALVRDLTRLCESEPVASELPSAPRHRASYESLLAATAHLQQVTSGPTYWLSRQPGTRSTAIEIVSGQGDLLRGTLDDWIPDLGCRRPFFASMTESQAVAVCASVRVTDAAEAAGVETAPGYRGQGHGANAVAAWAAAVLAMGKIPLYSTSWDNRASQSLARCLGFELFGEEYSIQ